MLFTCHVVIVKDNPIDIGQYSIPAYIDCMYVMTLLEFPCLSNALFLETF